jgi:hypothetical protein
MDKEELADLLDEVAQADEKDKIRKHLFNQPNLIAISSVNKVEVTFVLFLAEIQKPAKASRFSKAFAVWGNHQAPQVAKSTFGESFTRKPGPPL